MRLLYVCISFVMLSIIVLPLYMGITVIMPSMTSAGIFKYWLFALFLIICLLPPIILSGYFMAYAENPQKARRWLRDFALAPVVGLYWVGLLFVFETLVPPPPPKSYWGYGTEIWFTADFMISSIGLILTHRLTKYLQSRSKSIK